MRRGERKDGWARTYLDGTFFVSNFDTHCTHTGVSLELEQPRLTREELLALLCYGLSCCYEEKRRREEGEQRIG